MKKLLIVASCGIIVALVIGATNYTKVVPAEPDSSIEHVFDAKCAEPRAQKSEHSPCAMRARDDAHADMFLREIKRKIRRAYA